eukprot:SAG11_NODE_2462_length_3327_cov_2.195167_2_plen_73_part_00
MLIRLRTSLLLALPAPVLHNLPRALATPRALQKDRSIEPPPAIFNAKSCCSKCTHRVVRALRDSGAIAVGLE